jgi:hypothetical protein
MASWKQRQFNERLLELFMEKLALDPTWVKNHSCYGSCISTVREMNRDFSKSTCQP